MNLIAQTEDGMAIVAVALSGNPKLYHYMAPVSMLINVGKGDKVVIPNKVKDDGSLSLSIGTVDHVISTQNQLDEVPDGPLKPIVQVLDRLRLREVQIAVIKMEVTARG